MYKIDTILQTPEKKRSTFYIIGKAILFASMQFAIGSVEMSSKFSVKNFSKDQETLNNAADALSDYIMIGALWTIGTSFIFYANYGFMGAFWNIATNLAIIAWIYISYIKAFKSAADKYGLKEPKLFNNFYITF
jgi:hypothetical protein